MKKSIVLFATLGVILSLGVLMYWHLKINDKLLGMYKYDQNLLQFNYSLVDIAAIFKSFDTNNTNELLEQGTDLSLDLKVDAVGAKIAFYDTNRMYNIANKEERNRFALDGGVANPILFETLLKDKNITTHKQLQSIINGYLAKTKDESLDISNKQIYFCDKNKYIAMVDLNISGVQRKVWLMFDNKKALQGLELHD